MKRRIVINTLISIGIIFLYLFAGYAIYVKGISYSGIALFIFLIFTGGLSALLGISTCIWTMVTGKHWNNLFFISSGLTNLLVSCVLLPGINANMLRADFLWTLLLLLPLLILIWQIVVMVRAQKK